MSSPWIAANQINVALLNGLWQFRDYGDDTKGHDRHMPEQHKGCPSLQTTKTDIGSCLREVRGHNGALLSHVIRKGPDPLHADDLALAADSLDARMAKKAPHEGDGWRANNAKVAEVIAAASKGTDAWAWARPHCLTKDGRGACQGVIGVCKESGETNLADALSETQAWAVRQRLCDGLMHQKERSCRSPFG